MPRATSAEAPRANWKRPARRRCPATTCGGIVACYCRGEKHRAALEIRQSLPALPRETAWHSVYTSDFSKQGCGFLHSAILYPGERLRMILLTGVERAIEVAWCRRLDKNCYAIGAVFVETGSTPAKEEGSHAR